MEFRLIKTHFVINFNRKFVNFFIVLFLVFSFFICYYSGGFYSFNKFISIKEYLRENYIFKIMKLFMLLTNVLIIYIVCFNQKKYQIINFIKYSRIKNYFSKKIYEISILFLAFTLFFLPLLVHYKSNILNLSFIDYYKSFESIILTELLFLEIINLFSLIFTKYFDILFSFIFVFISYLIDNRVLEKNKIILQFTSNFFRYKDQYLIIFIIVILILIEILINLIKEY